MDHLITRAGGESETWAGKLIPSFVIDTAGVPAPSEQDGGQQSSAPEWIELLPGGVFFGRDGRGPFRLDDPAAVIEATAALGISAGLPIDYDHATDLGASEGRPAPAAGWIRELKVRGASLWGRVEWTARGAASIVAREYRYVSPVFQFDPKDGSVTRLLRAGLTNNPNLHLTAIASARAEGVAAGDEFMKFPIEELRELLHLGGDATAAEVIARVREISAGADAARGASAVHAHDPAHYVAIAEYERALTELNALRADVVRERAAHTVETAIRAGKIVPAQRAWAIAYCVADPRGFEAFAAKQPAVVGAGTILNGEPPFERRPGAMTAAEVSICAQLGLKHADFGRRKRGRADFLSLEQGPATETGGAKE
ncbi:MAG TPA: phage protease [Candidatus Acidoferrales bacterium]|nr:phage protease [Candidatus Acidoferrales bacterium]